MITQEHLASAPGALTVAGTAPLALHDPGMAYVVVEGEASIFMSPVRADGHRGERRYVCQIGRGQAALGAALGGHELLLVPMGEAIVLPARLSDVASAIAADDASAHQLFAEWVANADDAFDIFPSPGALESALGTGRMQLAPGAVLQAPGQLIWCRVITGEIRWHGYGTTLIQAGDVIPLSGGQDITAPQGAEIEILSSLTLGGAEAIEAAMRRSQVLLLTALAEKAAREDTERRAIFDRRLAEEREGVSRAVEAFVGLVTRSTIPTNLSGDPLLDAATFVGRSLGIKIIPPGRSEDMARLADPIEAIARASHFRTRRVLLLPPWWEHDNGPLLAYRQAKKSPVALLPIPGGYELLDPLNPVRVRVTAELAATLEPFAVMFYGSLPEGKLSAVKLVAFALQGKQRDLILVGIMGLIGSLLGMAAPQAMGMMVDHAIPDSDRGLLLQMGLGLLMASLGQVAFNICQGIVIQRVEARADASSQAAVWDRVLNLGAPFFRRYNVGDLNSRIMGIGQIRKQMSSQVLGTALSSIFAMFNLALMFSYSVPLAAVASLLVLVTLGVTSTVSIIRLNRAKPLRVLEGALQGLVVQLINGVPKLRASGGESRAFTHWATMFHKRAQIRQNLSILDSLLSVFNELMPVLSNMAIFYTACTAVGLAVLGKQGGLSTGIFLAFNAAYGTFLAAAAQLSNTAVSQLDLATVWQRVTPVLEEPPEVFEGQIDPGRLSGRVMVDHVTFRYEPGGKKILDDISIHAEPGEHIALVGSSGCGKSTLLRLLLGFEVPEMGMVAYDMQDLQKLDPRAVRRQLGTVLQAGKLNAGSVFDNVTAGAVLKQDEVWEAIRGAGMEADIKDMPMGLHTVVSEGGSNLSGGQRQRLLIARALALKPRVMLFDEATSALDNTTQAIVSATLERMRATRIVIAHRLSTIRNADRIYVFDAGKVVQCGTFDELAAQEGLFARLVARQTV
jgi:NHLM bacteriocin system ABC transporter ATP-binding protein